MDTQDQKYGHTNGDVWTYGKLSMDIKNEKCEYSIGDKGSLYEPKKQISNHGPLRKRNLIA